MSDVLTTSAPLKCSHQGTLSVVASVTLTVGNTSVFGEQALLAPKIVGCSASTPCTAVSAVTAGVATALVVDGNPVILASLAATTNAGTLAVTPPPPLPPSTLTSA